MRLRNTIEFLGLWKQLNNPDFNMVDFDQFKNQAGGNTFGLFPSASSQCNEHLNTWGEGLRDLEKDVSHIFQSLNGTKWSFWEFFLPKTEEKL